MARSAPSGTAVVTGAARGIGRAIAAQPAAQGFHVAVADVDDDRAADVVDKIVADGGHASLQHADMNAPAQIDGMLAAAAEIDGGLAMQAAARLMKDAGGDSIVDVASIAGKGWKETSNVAYAAAQGAVVTMTRIAAARFGEYGIRVDSVCPGMTRTELMEGWLQGRSESEGRSVDDLRSEISRQVPLQRLNQPADVAAAVGFLGSDAARTITGRSLNVDGGIVWDRGTAEGATRDVGHPDGRVRARRGGRSAVIVI
jgi:NAD(P)-dependent dehydrogenase (short-subunit alcohol dehydrogenase family)